MTLLRDKVDVNAFGKGRGIREHNLLFRFFPFMEQMLIPNRNQMNTIRFMRDRLKRFARTRQELALR